MLLTMTIMAAMAMLAKRTRTQTTTVTTRSMTRTKCWCVSDSRCRTECFSDRDIDAVWAVSTMVKDNLSNRRPKQLNDSSSVNSVGVLKMA